MASTASMTVVIGVVRRWSNVASTASMTVGLGDTMHSLDNVCVLMYERRAMALSGVEVASTTIRPSEVNTLISSEVGTTEDDDGEFQSVRKRYALRVC